MSQNVTDPIGDWLEFHLTDGHYRLFVRDLMLPFLIGVHAHEQGRSQRVRFNVELLVRDPIGPMGDKLANTVSYEDIVAAIKALSGEGHINLVETLAERVAEICLANDRVSQVRVRVEKLDIEPAAGSVGVEIVRRAAAPGRGSVIHLASISNPNASV